MFLVLLAYSASMILIWSAFRPVCSMTISPMRAASASVMPLSRAETTTLMLSSPRKATQSV